MTARVYMKKRLSKAYMNKKVSKMKNNRELNLGENCSGIMFQGGYHGSDTMLKFGEFR